MIYSISKDIAGGAVNSDKLQSEILAANCVTNFNGIEIQGDVLTINCDVADAASQATLDAVVKNHVAFSLDDAKDAKWDAIDSRTDAIIAGGFDFDNNHFSLSTEAQTNWLGLGVFQNSLPWPFDVTNSDNIAYSLTLPNLPQFLAAGVAVIQGAVSSGRALKIQVANAQTIDDVNAVVDNR